MEIKKIEIVENGELREYDVLFTIKDITKNKMYVLYTDIKSNIDIYAGIYNEKEQRLDYIESEKEQKMIKEVMEVVKEELD